MGVNRVREVVMERSLDKGVTDLAVLTRKVLIIIRQKKKKFRMEEKTGTEY